MRGGPTFLLSILVLASGCIATPENVESAAAETDVRGPEGGILAHPRVLPIPAGSSYTLAWLNATAEDWVDYDERERMLNLAFEISEGAEFAGLSVVFLEAEGSKLGVRGTHGTTSPGGAGSNGRLGEPEAVTTIVAVSVMDAAAPFEVVVGADEWADFDMAGETLSASIIEQGEFAGFGMFIEFGSPFSVLFDTTTSVGFEVADSRVHPPAASDIAGAAGTLRLSLAHALESPGIHTSLFFADSFQASRAGTWSYALTVDDETTQVGGVYADPVPVSAFAGSDVAPARSLVLDVTLEALAEVFPVTVVSSTTIPWDPSRLGFAFDERAFDTGVAPIVHTRAGCIRADAPEPPAPAACAQLL